MKDFINELKTLSLIIIDKFYIVDVFNDLVEIYKKDGNSVNLVYKKSLQDFIESSKQNVLSIYITDFLNMFSIPKLKEKLASKNVATISYENYNRESKMLYATLSQDEQRILLLEINDNKKKLDDGSIKYNRLLDEVCDSLIKINNSFNVTSDTNLKEVEKYINSVIYSLSNDNLDIKKNLNKISANISSYSEKTILIIDDDSLTRNMIKKIFDEEYKMVMLSNGLEAINYFKDQNSKSVLDQKDNILGIFLDLTMPVLDGFKVLDYLSEHNLLSKIPVIIISGDYEKETKKRVYNYNIADMLEKPFDFEIVRYRINKFINLYNSSNSLSSLVGSQNDEFEDILDFIIKSYLYDYKDKIKKIEDYTYKIGLELSKNNKYNLDQKKVNDIKEVSKYYDIGVYSIPKLLLLRKETVNKDNIDFIKNYPNFGALIVSLLFKNDESKKMLAQNICKSYRENYDGSGYPDGLKEDDIPLEAQIVAAASLLVDKNYDESIINPVINEVVKKIK